MTSNKCVAYKRNRWTAPGLAIGGLLAAALLSMANANADITPDPFAGAGGLTGSALDALLPAAATPPPFDLAPFAISVDGVTVFQDGTASATSGMGDVAIAYGPHSTAIAGGVDEPGQFDTAIADGAGSEAVSGYGNFDTAVINGTGGVAAAGGGNSTDLSNYDYASILGPNGVALAGSRYEPSSNDVAIVDDPNGSVGSEAVAANGMFDDASVLGDNSAATAGFGGDFDIAQVLADGLTASATGANFLTDIVP
jgi:hypothetical protein